MTINIIFLTVRSLYNKGSEIQASKKTLKYGMKILKLGFKVKK